MPLEDSYIAMQLLARLLSAATGCVDLIFCAFAGAISSGMTFLEQTAMQAKVRPKSAAFQSQATTRRGTQNIINSQSSVGSQEDYNMFLEADTDSIDLTASPTTAIAAIITAFNAMTTFFHSSPDCILQPNTLTYLRTIASETVARLLNKPLRHITYAEPPAPAIIKAVLEHLRH